LNGQVSNLDHRQPAARPKAIDTAFLFTLIGIALGATGTVLTTLVDHERVVRLARDALSRSGQPYTEADVLAMIGPMRVAGGILVAVVAALLVLVAFKVRAGRNWARLVLTVFALLGAFDFITAVSAEGAALELIWNLAGVAFVVTAVVYLFRPESAKYFAGRRRVR
jgi:hypothetical protein